MKKNLNIIILLLFATLFLLTACDGSAAFQPIEVQQALVDQAVAEMLENPPTAESMADSGMAYPQTTPFVENQPVAPTNEPTITQPVESPASAQQENPAQPQVQPQSTAEAQRLADPAITKPTATPFAGEQANVGVIAGKLSPYPVNYLAQHIVAFNIDTNTWYDTYTNAGQVFYQLNNLPPGVYHVMAFHQGMTTYEHSLSSAFAYTVNTSCGSTNPTCYDDHSLADVIVTAGYATEGINLTDSYGYFTSYGLSWQGDPTLPHRNTQSPTFEKALYQDESGVFEIQYPINPAIPNPNDAGASRNLPVLYPDSLLSQKRVAFSVEQSNSCAVNQNAYIGEVTHNGIVFKVYQGSGVALGTKIHTFTYQTVKADWCVSIDFYFHIGNPMNHVNPQQTPAIPAFDEEFKVIEDMLLTFKWLQ